MGLDITAYKQIEIVENPKLDSDGYPEDDNFMRLWANPDFPGRELPLIHKAIYTQGSDSYGFRAGSYSGYNVWRNELAKLAGYTPIEARRHDFGALELRHDSAASEQGSGPFFELIHFSDCEGIIGPLVSEKLFKDFCEFEEKAKNHESAFKERFYDLYKEWKTAFEYGSDNGVVEFR